MENEIEFKKYKSRGSDYHYRQIKKNVLGSFNAYVYARYTLELELILKIIQKLHKKGNYDLNLLDVGCGDGVIIYLIQKKLKNIRIKLFGIDLSEEALEIAKLKNPKCVFKVADVYNIPFEDNYFNIIIYYIAN